MASIVSLSSIAREPVPVCTVTSYRGAKCLEQLGAQEKHLCTTHLCELPQPRQAARSFRSHPTHCMHTTHAAAACNAKKAAVHAKRCKTVPVLLRRANPAPSSVCFSSPALAVQTKSSTFTVRSRLSCALLQTEQHRKKARNVSLTLPTPNYCHTTSPPYLD
jgi:hypothetical protein